MIDYKNSILIACEKSQIVTKAFRELGYSAYSCDILPGEINSDWHLLGNIDIWINCSWKAIIAFPPCTYVSAASTQLIYDKNHKLKNYERIKQGFYGKDLFLKFYHNKAKYIAIENPRNCKIFGYPTNRYYWNPCEFGHNYSKKSYFWLKNLPPLMPPFINLNYQKDSVKRRAFGFDRSKFHPLVAAEMAKQWGYIIFD